MSDKHLRFQYDRIERNSFTLSHCIKVNLLVKRYIFCITKLYNREIFC